MLTMPFYDYYCKKCNETYEIHFKSFPTKKALVKLKCAECESPLEHKITACFVSTSTPSENEFFPSQAKIIFSHGFIFNGKKIKEGKIQDLDGCTFTAARYRGLMQHYSELS